MANTQVASYSLGVAFDLDRSSITKLNAQINRIKKSLETKLNNLSVTGIRINAVSLNRALRQASTSIVLPISNFQVNAVALRQQVQAAFNRGVTLRVNAVSAGTGTGGAGARTPSRRGGTDLDRLAQFGTRALPAFASFSGLANINAISQGITSGRMALNTVTAGRGVDAYDWLKRQGNELGIDYRAATPTFTNFLASSVNKQGYDNALQSYRDITTYGLTHGATGVSMERANLALGQMWSKGKVMGEELNQQLAEATGFGNVRQLFAEAYQERTGGKLTGQKAEAALIDAMKKGKVLSADVIPIVTRKMGEESKTGLSTYQTSSAAAQARFVNALTTAIEKFGRSGFDSAMSRFFNNLTKWLERSDELVRKLGSGFSILINFMEALVESGIKVFNFFNNFIPSITMATLVLVPLAKIVGATGIAFLGLALAMDDISHFVEGKDSVFGSLINYLKDLTGFDWTGIAAGIGIIGVAFLTAFAPITALALSIAALVEAFDYLQKLKAKEAPIVATSATLPTYAQMNAQNQRLASEAFDKNPGLGTGWTLANVSLSNLVSGDRSFSGGLASSMAGSMNSSPEFRNKLLRAKAMGVISEAEVDRALSALGSGASNPSAMEEWLNKRTTFNPNVTGMGSEPFKIGVVNVIDTTAKELGFIEAVNQASTQFIPPTTLAPSKGN